LAGLRFAVNGWQFAVCSWGVGHISRENARPFNVTRESPMIRGTKTSAPSARRCFSPTPSVNGQRQTANGQPQTGNANPLRHLDGQYLAPTIIPTGRACCVATDAATTLWALGQLWGVPAVGGFSRPKSHLGRLSFWYTHWFSSSFLSSIRLRLPTHLAGLALFLPPPDAVPLDRGIL
jgi:hypothetical protein